jgi:hypothetical protein
MSQMLPNLTVWVHTCPQRIERMTETLESLEASDLAGIGWQICSAGEGSTPYPWPKTVEWWMDHWLEMAKLGDWVLRIEDDVVVYPHIGHNLATWPAINEPDFGIGLGFVFDFAVRDLGGIEFLPNKVVRSKATAFAGGQVQLMPSSIIPQLVAHLRERMRTDERLPGPGPIWFDSIITQELYNLGKRTYLHVPSVARAGSLSTESSASLCERYDHYANRTAAPDWKRPDDYELEFLAESLLCDKRTRWAVLGDGSVVKCITPALLDPLAGPVTINGTPLVLRSSCLYDTSTAAYLAAKQAQ